MTPQGKKIAIVTGGLAATSTVLYFVFRDSPGKIGQIIRSVESKFGSTDDINLQAAPPTSIVASSNNSLSSSSPVNSSSSGSTTGNTYTPKTGLVCKKWIADTFPLRPCSKGDNVRKMQLALNKNSGINLTVDSYYGNETAKALASLPSIKQGAYIIGTSSFFNASGDIIKH